MIPEPILKIDRVSFKFPGKEVLKQINLSVQKGEVAALIGSSGSGKTTLFKIITGILTPQEGSVIVDGKTLPLAASAVAYMMQVDLLLPWRTILGNLTLTSELGREPYLKASVREEAKALLADMGLSGHEEMYPDQLSGGMRQRVSLSRALLQKRPLLLLDEPFGSLDVSLREQMYALLRQLKSKMNTTMLLITHDFRDAVSLADRIFLIANGSISKEWQIPQEQRHDLYFLGSIQEQMREVMMTQI